jgi:hypothetical protein
LRKTQFIQTFLWNLLFIQLHSSIGAERK